MLTETVSYSAALVAGLLSFFSPCILPVLPGFFTFITGFSLDELTTAADGRLRRKVLVITLAYVAGFSLVFILLGASASLLGNLLFTHQKWLRIIGGALIILFGLHLTGLLRIKGLDFEHRVNVRRQPLHLLGVFLVGMAFGAGWSPCIGPLLGSILILASEQNTVWQGIRLLIIYSAGMALPFIVMAFFINSILVFLAKARRWMGYVNWVAGVLLILVGIGLMTNKLVILARLS
jgi:cytochrome c-type biogenesis protein